MIGGEVGIQSYILFLFDLTFTMIHSEDSKVVVF